MESTQKQEVTALEISRRIGSLALPMVMNQLINTASSFICMAMIAHLGHTVLAASALIFPTQISIMMIGMSFLFSIGILVGRANGANDYFNIGNIVQQGWTLALLLSIPIIILFLNVGKILVYLGQERELADIVQYYFHAYAWGVIPMLLGICNMQFAYGIHKKMLVVTISMAGVVVLLVSAYLLIFGKFGFPELGVAGMGYAIVMMASFFFITTTLFYYFEKSFKKYNLFHYRVHKNLGHFAEMFKLSWPICLQMGGETVSLLACAAMVGWLGTFSLAAYQVVNQYAFLTIGPIFLLSQAGGILVGQACGAKQFREVKKLGYVSLLIVLLVTSLIAAIFIFIPKALASFYIDVSNPNNAKTLHLIGLLFCVVAFSQIFDGLRNVLIGILRGLLDTRFPMYVGLSAIWFVGIPLSYLFAFTLQIGVVGIALGGLCGMFVGTLILFFRLQHLFRDIK